MLKEELKERYKKIFKREFKDFLKNIQRPPLNSIRVNTIKISVEELRERMERKGWKVEQFKWYGCGFFVHEPEFKLGSTLEFSLGYYYVQEASSMIPPLILDPQPGEIILDMCAAPGSKTTQIAQMMKNRGIIVANDVTLDRLVALGSNLQRCGVANCIVTQMDGVKFAKLKQRFDRVLVDAPCSGTGTLRSNPSIGKELSVAGIRRLSGLQKRLILAGFDTLKENGMLVYSTCSLEPEENEEVIDFLLRKRDNVEVEEVKLKKFKMRKGLRSWEGRDFDERVKLCGRIYPHDNFTDGFFIAKVRKK